LSANTLNIGNSINSSINIVSPSGNTNLSGSPVILVQSVQPMLNGTTQPPALVPQIIGEAAAPAQFTSAGLIPPATITCNAACQAAHAVFGFTVWEEHPDAWRAPAAYYDNTIGAPLNGTTVLYTFSGMLPGSTLQGCILTWSNPAQIWTLTGNGIGLANGTTTYTAEPTFTPLATLSQLDSLTLTCGTPTSPAYIPNSSVGNFATSPITVTMQPAPVGTANVPNAPTTNNTLGGFPRYQSTGGTVGPLTVVQFGASSIGQTTMLIPYALANVGTYDTGISIANTTKDPMFGTTAQGAAPDSTGSITFNFFPGDGSANFSVTPPPDLTS